MSNRVLVIDDKELMRDSISTMMARAGWTVQVAADGRTALKMLARQKPEAILTDLAMPGMDGIELLREIRRVDEHLPVVMMTAYATVQTAVDAMKQGAFDYLTKPFEGDELLLTMRRAIKHASLVKENAVLKTQLQKGRGTAGVPVLVGDTPIMCALKDQIGRIAQSQGTVLITGESGAGKEVVAQMIHALSPRSRSPMLALNCAALSTSLLESELFGHERGAFTGAEKLRKGRFELADGGTLLLDEISEIPPNIQAKLLRVLQERAFERVGSSVTQQTDVRVLATTNRNLRQAVEAGRFRQDLYFRLNVLPVEVPPLRLRADDVEPLCDHFLKMVADREGRAHQHFDDDALAVLRQYRWPGNVRELCNICERASIFAADRTEIRAALIEPWLALADVEAGQTRTATPHVRSAVPVQAAPPNSMVIRPDSPETSMPIENSVPAAVESEAPGQSNTAFGATNLPADSTRDFLNEPENGTAESNLPIPEVVSQPATTIAPAGRSLEEIEREVIVATLQRHRGHRQHTAQELGIGVRTLGLKLRKWKDAQLVAADL
jgi:two-component system response regulator HydG